MSQTVRKKSVKSMRRKAQVSANKNRKKMKRPQVNKTARAFAEKTNTATKTPGMIERKESVTITPIMEKTDTTQNSMASQSGHTAIDVFVVKERMQRKTEAMPAFKPKTASEIKEEAIEKVMKYSAQETPVTPTAKNGRKISNMRFTNLKRVLLALACASAAVFAVVYFVNINSPNIALKVAAIQNGIDATYPRYIPRGYELSNITSENGKITLNFRNPDEESAFIIIEEKSGWDSNALFTNHVKNNYREDYSTIKEQGLTIYVDRNEACWVNGGVFYELKIISGELTKKQITTIATTR